MKLSQLLTLTQDTAHARYVRKERRFILLCLAGWAVVYAIAILGACMKFVD